MKKLFKKSVILLMCIILCGTIGGISANASETEENYQVISDEFNSETDVKTYSVSIDFTSMDSAAICLVKTGKSDVTLKIADESGTIIGTRGTSAGRSWFYIDKPSTDVGIVQYTLTLTPKNYDSEYNSFRIMVGNKTETEKMISGQENTVMLESYTADSLQFLQSYTPNKYETWYKITAVDSTTVFTLCNYYPQIRFKLQDVNTLEVLFDSNDSNNDDVHKTEYVSNFSGAEKARITTTIGQDYYMVIYAPSVISSSSSLLEKSMNIAVGMPNMIGTTSSIYYASSSATGTTSSFSPTRTINVSTNLPETAVVDTVYIYGPTVFSLGIWKVKGPSMTSWKQTTSNFRDSIDFNYIEGSSSNKSLKGNWSVCFKGATTSITAKPGLKFSYYYELGD